MSAERPIDLAQQLLAHLESLRRSGVQLVPRGAALELPELVLRKNEPEPTQDRNRLVQPPEPEIHRGQPQANSSLFVPPPAPLPDMPEGRRHALSVLAQEVSGCDLCGELFSTRTQTVFGVGPVDPDVAFVGEAPGADEDRQGEPFVGRAGQLLNRIIARCGFTRKEVYIFNVLKCRPPNNRNPNPTECENCRPFLERQFDLVKPKYIVALGAIAAKNLLQTTESIGSLRGRVHQYRGRPLICTYHPSFLLRDESRSKWWDCWEDMKLLLNTMGRPIPEAKQD
jgi:uracil-DNA glycosylase family 4